MPAVKSISYTNATFGGLLDYMHKDERQGKQQASLLKYMEREGSTTFEFTYLHNLPGIDLEDRAAIEQAFKENDTYRARRANGNNLYQEILSFSPKDREFLINNPEALWAMANVYLEKRAPRSLGVARVHTDKDHTHLHFMISANEVCSAKATRMSKYEFAEFKEYIEEYQKEKYPELTHSRINHTPYTKKSRSVADIVKEALKTSVTRGAFEAKLKEEGVEVYTRRGKLQGVLIDGRKSRFSTLLPLSKQELAEHKQILEGVPELEQTIQSEFAKIRERRTELEKTKTPDQSEVSKTDQVDNDFATLRQSRVDREYNFERELDDE